MAKKLWIENISTPSVLWQEEIPAGDWIDCTNDAIAWDLYGYHVLDYLMYRDKINQILFIKANPNYPTIDFSGFFNVLSNEERLIMCKYILAPYALRLTIVDDSIDFFNWDRLVLISKGNEPINNPYTGRALVVEKMRKYVSHIVRVEQMTMANTQLFFEDVFNLVELYISSANPKFKQWLTNMVGTQYENDGFAQKSYYNEQIKNDLINIYNGE
jgi:hypothetical protein